MRIRNLPKTDWDISLYNTDYYGYGDVDVFTSKEKNIGERVICLFRKKDLEYYTNDSCTKTVFAILCNSCGVKSGIPEVRGLVAGQIVPVQFNGEYNPQIPLIWIQKRFWEI
jgi:hypothetical protein